MDNLCLERGGAESLAEYGRVPISFAGSSRLDLGALPELVELPVEPFTKDYDAFEKPLSWASRWDISRWLVLSASVGNERAGGAVVAWNTPGVDMLEGRDDLAVLWDIRVGTAFRGHGVGRALFEEAVKWAREKGCTELKVETQDNNVAACRFYAAMGCRIDRVVPGAYDELPDEAMILWKLDLV